MAVWTQRVDILWRPELDFFEERSAILRDIEKADLLAEFRWTATDVSVRIGPFEDVMVGVAGATITIASPLCETDRTREVLKQFLDRLAPSNIVLGPVHLQCLDEVPGMLPEVQADGTGHHRAQDADGCDARLGVTDGWSVRLGPSSSR